jgi:predicted TIM-barrel fold metal-dependent hydrolase
MRRLSLGILAALLASACARPCPPVDLYAALLDPDLPARVAASQQPDFLADLPKISTHEHYRAGGSFEAYRGLKLMSGHPDFYRSPLDGPPMLALFAEAQKLGIPVLMHVSPMRIPKQMAEFEHLLDAFPRVLLIAAHYARTPPDFTETARLLERHPNLYMDISMGGGLSRYQGEIPRFLRAYRAFILAHQDRLMWGTDMILDAEETEASIRARVETDFLLLGKQLYVTPRSPASARAIEFGLDLPRPVLAKIFYDNPIRILGIH